MGTYAHGFDFRGSTTPFALEDIADCDVGACFRQSQSRVFSEPASRTGHDGRLTGQVEELHHVHESGLLHPSLPRATFRCSIGHMEWERVRRVPVYESPKAARCPAAARYPSVEKTASGRIFVLFTRQTKSQENARAGDLMLARSDDAGGTWSVPRVVFESIDCVPRAHGTLTCLPDGRLAAPFAVESLDRQASTVRILVSTDEGDTWESLQPEVAGPFCWLCPTGRIVRSSERTLVMPVFGAFTTEDLRATVHSAGVLFSCDGGETWGDFRPIAAGNGRVIGAARTSRFAFEAPAIQPLNDGRWLAVVTARRLTEGPGAPQVLCRSWSTDQGRSWTPVDQLIVGAWSSLIAVDEHTVVCPYTEWCAFAGMKVLFSYDGFTTFSQQLPVLLRGWLKGWGRHNVHEEVPPYPTVPFSGEHRWTYDHFGFPSAAALGERFRRNGGHSLPVLTAAFDSHPSSRARTDR